MYYFINSCYCKSELKALERKAVDDLRILKDKIISEDQIPLIEKWLHRVHDRLKAENPRCHGVRIEVYTFTETRMLYINFGTLRYYGIQCRFLGDNEINQ